MAGIIGNGLTALLANQRALQVVGNNIANANTEGYVRQRVQMAQAGTQGFVNLSFGLGVKVAGVERLYDQLLTEQYREAGSLAARAEAFDSIATRANRLLGHTETGIAASIQRFFAQMDVVSRDPTSMANRQQLLTEGQALATRFADLMGEMGRLGFELDARIRQSVEFVNQTASQIATLNERIVAQGTNPPANLLDQRDLLVQRLAEHLDVRTVTQPDGSLSVFAGSGQSLVIGTRVNTLEVRPDVLDPGRLEVGIRAGGSFQEITGRIAGGTLGGLIAARTDILEPAQLQLAQLAVGLASAVNDQHRQGVDYDGQLGGDFFTIPSPRVLAATTNTGTATVTAVVADSSALAAREYELRYDGTVWTALDRSTGNPVTLAGTGTVGDPFLVDGVAITVSGSAAAGDQFLVRPTLESAGRLQVALTHPARVAAAGPLTTSADPANLSDAGISSATVTDIAHPDLMAGAEIEFVTAGTYTVTINGTVSGPFAHTPGTDIQFAGWSVRISGTPQAGDLFHVEATRQASGDNANALRLSGIFQQGFFDGGRQSFSDLNADIVSNVGAIASRAANDLSAQQVIREQAALDLESLSGVNLDEEAADLLKYQEAYQAAAKVIAVGDELFRTILAAVGR